MSRLLHNAIVRKPAANLKDGLTTVSLGLPDYERAIDQHREYCLALEGCGLNLIRLESDDAFPDSTFVEDTAVLTERGAILTRPGALSRRGEVTQMASTVTHWFEGAEEIVEPATVDGGDVCEVGNHYFVGISERTNEAGARQLKDFLIGLGHTCSLIDIPSVSNLLHLKSGLASLGDNRLVVTDALASFKEFSDYELVRIAPEEDYAANCIRINDHLLIAKGYPKFAAMLAGLGYRPIELEMSEFQKLDGGLSCLSLRF